MKRGGSEQETLRLNGWGAGTRLCGTERVGDWWSQSIIEITYLKRDGRGILARTIRRTSSRGRYDVTEPSEEERSWTLDCRDWVQISPDVQVAMGSHAAIEADLTASGVESGSECAGDAGGASDRNEGGRA